MWFLCGLGNPDKKYELTRHNVGFDIINALIDSNDCQLIKKDKTKELYRGKVGIYDCLLCKTLNYMNRSGPPIGELVSFYKIPKSQILICHDDLDLEIGKVKIKIGGGNGGHNGLLSIDETIGKNYRRLRMGIGRPASKELVSPYVLEKFTNTDREIINNKISLLVENFSLIFEDQNLFLTKITF